MRSTLKRWASLAVGITSLAAFWLATGFFLSFFYVKLSSMPFFFGRIIIFFFGFSIQKVFPYFFSTFILFHLHGFTIKSMSIGFLRKVMIWGINIMCQKYFPFHSMFFPKWNIFNIFDLWSFHSLSWQHRDSGHSLCLSGKNVEPAMALSE